MIPAQRTAVQAALAALEAAEGRLQWPMAPQACREAAARVSEAAAGLREVLMEVAEPTPIDMIPHCPACGLQHIDEPERSLGPGNTENLDWDNPPHRSHLCGGCNHIWRPADVPTNGVAEVQTRGQNDSPVVRRPA